MGLANIDPRIERDYGDLTFGSAVAISSIWLRFFIVQGCRSVVVPKDPGSES